MAKHRALDALIDQPTPEPDIFVDVSPDNWKKFLKMADPEELAWRVKFRPVAK